jgi:chromosome segregation ATPase
LKYDGTYSAVTFICSKTDDISVTEAAEGLDIEAEISESWARITELQDSVRKTKSDIAELRDERDVCENLIDEIEQAWDKWEALGTKVAEGKTVYAPPIAVPKKQKRKRVSKPRGSRKNLTSSDVGTDFSDPDGADSSDKENQESPDEARVPLTSDDIDAKLASLKGEKKEVRAKKKQLDERMSTLREEMTTLNSERDATLAEVKAICIQGRNQYSRKAIKQDFALGIKE